MGRPNVPFPGGPPPGQPVQQVQINVAGMVETIFRAHLSTQMFRDLYVNEEAKRMAMTAVAQQTALAVKGQIEAMKANPQFAQARIAGDFDRMENIAGNLLRQFANGIAGCEVIPLSPPKAKDDGNGKTDKPSRIITDV